MPCESCKAQFTFLKRKKSCTECRRLYCKSCLVRRDECFLCPKCIIFTKRPLSKVDLVNVKSKDLIFYLQSKHISTSGCVEKDELINLIIAHVNYADRSNIFAGAQTTGGSSKSGGIDNHTENCSNPFDQIKNTCQSLFSSLTEKIANDLQKTTNFEMRASSSGNNQQEPNVFTQPRFTNDNIYNCNNNNTNNTNNITTTTTTNNNNNNNNNNNSNVPNSSSNQSIRVTAMKADSKSNSGSSSRHHTSASTSGGPTLVDDIDDDGGSGLTSGADSSANSSSLSSPMHEHTRSIPSVEPSNHPKNKQNINIHRRIENILASESNNGCDCSDDEHMYKNKKKSRKSASHDNILSLNQAGPSGCATFKTSKSAHKLLLNINGDYKTDTDSSSFEELVAESVANATASNNDIDVALSTDTDNWQFVNSNTTDSNVTNITLSDPPMNAEVSGNNQMKFNNNAKRIARRRSDSFLVNPDSEQHDHNGEAACSDAGSQCRKCGKRKSGIKRHLKKIRKQLETCNGTEEDKRKQLEKFLDFLEQRSKNSFDFSDSESTTEDVSVETPNSETGASTSSPILNKFNRENGIFVYASGSSTLLNMQHHIKLTDISSSSDLDILSVKQLKEILMLNRVDFKGCCEKAELRERVLRLWRDHKSIPAIERLPTDDLCKICMDAPIECVILECGHMTTCTQCGKVLSECPICRQYIVRVVRFFRA